MEEKLSRMTPLILFTSLLIIAVGLALGETTHVFVVGSSGGESTLLPWSLSLAILGALIAFTHLGHPGRSWRTIQGVIHSWLSREALLSTGFSVCIGAAAWTVTDIELVSWFNILLWAAAGFGAAAIWSIAVLYQLPAQIGWNGWTQRLTPFAGAVLIGATGTLVLGNATWEVPVFSAILMIDLTLTVLRLRHFLSMRHFRYALVYPGNRSVLVLSHTLRLILTPAVALLVYNEIYTVSLCMVAGAVCLDRFSFYAGAAQLTPKATITHLRNKRMSVATH
ncbi:MAG: dimethyl sulfoxide reductase anchor subunit [Deltaproteobacteria bacterium]|nr:dimethyl sulfoxide reductase anchor subunit [Deltaproteobacteria bacterium]